MKATDKAFNLIAVMRSINQRAKALIFDEGSQLRYSDYKELSDFYRQFLECVDKYPDLFFRRLKAELPDDKYDEIVLDLHSEFNSFIEWYVPISDSVNSFFSHEATDTIIDKEANSKYGLCLSVAESELEKAINDEGVWHDLARAYGSRTTGGKKEDALTEEDMAYIAPSLEEYKTHFRKEKVNLEEMYDEYQNQRIPEEQIRMCKDKIMAIRQSMNSELDKLRLELECDIFKEIHGAVVELNQQLLPGQGTLVFEPVGGNALRGQGRKYYGTYSCLRDCITRQDVYEAILVLAQKQIDNGNKISTSFGWLVFKRLLANCWINHDGCSLEHWGELILKEFGQHCSFKNGRSIRKAKEDNRGDFALEVEMDSILPHT